MEKESEPQGSQDHNSVTLLPRPAHKGKEGEGEGEKEGQAKTRLMAACALDPRELKY